MIGMILAFGLVQHQARTVAASRVIAPDFELMTFDGEYLRLSDLRGQVVMLNFWASWCGPCRVEAPDIQAAWEHYADRDDVVFVGIAYHDQIDNTRAFIEDHGLTYINGPDLGHVIVDAYGVQAIPATFIIGKDGAVEDYLFAQVTMDSLIASIDAALR